MLKMIEKFGVDVEAMREAHLPEEKIRFQFTSKRKRMSTIMEKLGGHSESNCDKRIHLKGASEIVLESCTYYIDENGKR